MLAWCVHDQTTLNQPPSVAPLLPRQALSCHKLTVVRSAEPMMAGGRVQVGQVQSRRRGIISISQFKRQCYNQWNHPSNWQHTQNRRDNPLQYSMLLQPVQPAARLQAQRIRYCGDILILSFVWTRLVGDGAPILLLQGPHRCVHDGDNVT